MHEISAECCRPFESHFKVKFQAATAWISYWEAKGFDRDLHNPWPLEPQIHLQITVLRGYVLHFTSDRKDIKLNYFVISFGSLLHKSPILHTSTCDPSNANNSKSNNNFYGAVGWWKGTVGDDKMY